MIPEKLLKPYNPKETESRIYQIWEASGFFNPDKLPNDRKEPFTIIMPPPNANGHLHAGHALGTTLEDLMIRYKRMQGFKTLWLPGADHAGFETQIVYEKKLEKEGRSRFKMDPKELYQEIYNFTQENKKKMESEIRALGASCDWSREKFTLDPDVIKTVHQTFKKMFDDGLIYRASRLVNWCTKHQTSLSDVETVSKEMTDKLYYLKYGPLVVATVRPETMFGDGAIAVNPEDSRYQKYIGQNITVETPIGQMDLPVVADAAVEMEFGTGALKITPSHDKNDFEIAARHNLPKKEVIDQFGRLNEKTGKYKGLKVLEARKQVVADLESMHLIEKIEDYTHPVPVCYKCETIIEPRELPQWFVKMKPLADLALKAAEENRVIFHPENYKKIFTYWMENTIDWNISRQIVWGIPIPAKICQECGEAFPDLDDSIRKCPKCGGAMVADTDTFDTWFSSGQWPLITLGFPDQSDFKTFYPTSVMESGYDLIFKWIPRMVIFGLYLAKEVPFQHVYLHGLVNDSKGKKMSKSKGNVVSPLELIEKYGTDALRMALIVGNPPGSDMSLDENKIRGYKNFANKIWNIARFVLTNSENYQESGELKLSELQQKQLTEFNKLLKEVTNYFENFQFHLAAENIYHYIWHTFADKIIEESKTTLKENPLGTQWFLRHLLKKSLALLHPFMPFITEEIWSFLPKETAQSDLLMVASWPSNSK
ncbi:MAG TPA: valine--tRNA ligase [Candidatus Paceibacterota bacterium]|nr:valine--tRNA ligase [Candidatus Paceibacterota bacterium]